MELTPVQVTTKTPSSGTLLCYIARIKCYPTCDIVRCHTKYVLVIFPYPFCMQEIIFLFLVKAPKGIRQDNTTNITVFIALFLNMFLLKIRHFKQVLSETGVGETGERGGGAS